MRTNIPKIALAVASLANALYPITINLLMIFLIAVLFGVPLHLSSLLLPILVLPIIMFAAGLGLVVSVIGIIAKDLTSLVTQALTLLMYLTPVVFLSDNIKVHFLHRLIMGNPLTYLIDVPRSVLLGEAIAYWPQYIEATVLAFVVLILGLKVFDIIQDLVAERL
jgi:lipopolysaccharide transport system permease protein